MLSLFRREQQLPGKHLSEAQAEPAGPSVALLEPAKPVEATRLETPLMDGPSLGDGAPREVEPVPTLVAPEEPPPLGEESRLEGAPDQCASG